ncbi:hypothetical protein RvY_17124 [Ramazzottius varieornatus]|uniref:Uncharacterized protein n=1 Tax=Ramazzottius varieornatus TaxID=947166 RepID=A0A1D1W118_RAMVA|nr:hypothetical protein RvY_17124 [Ramazzottius varieornatus]
MIQQMHRTPSRSQLLSVEKERNEDGPENMGSPNESEKATPPAEENAEEETRRGKEDQITDSLFSLAHQLHQWCEAEAENQGQHTRQNETFGEKSYMLSATSKRKPNEEPLQNTFGTLYQNPSSESHNDNARRETSAKPSEDNNAACTCAALIICECDAKALLNAGDEFLDPSVSRLALLRTTISQCRGVLGNDQQQITFNAGQKQKQKDGNGNNVVVSSSSPTTSTGSWRRHAIKT